MKKHSYAVIALATLALFSANKAGAVEEQIKNYRGIRSLGMGGLLTTTGRYDEALFGNPATQMDAEEKKLILMNIFGEVNTNFINDFDKVSDVTKATGTGIPQAIAEKGLAGRNEHARFTIIPAGYYDPKFFGEKIGFSSAVFVNQQTNLMLRSNVNVEAQAFLDVGAAFGSGIKLLDDALNVGMNLRFVYRLGGDPTLTAADFANGQRINMDSIAGQGLGVDTDLGAYYKLPLETFLTKRLGFGFSLNNLLMSTYRLAFRTPVPKAKGNPPNNDRTVGLGVKADLADLWILTDTIAAVEFQDIGTTRRLASFWKKLHIGAETHFLKMFTFRMGLNQGYATGGVGVDLPIVKIDLATYGEEMTGNTGKLEDRRAALNFRFEI